MSERVTKSWSEQQMMVQNEGPVLPFRLRCSVCVRSLCGFFFFPKENLHSRPPEYHLLVPHTPGLVRVQLCSAGRQLGQQLTRAAASLSYVSAFRKQQHPFFLTQFKVTNVLAEIIKDRGGHSLIILFRCTSIYVNWWHLSVKSSAAELIFPVALGCLCSQLTNRTDNMTKC